LRLVALFNTVENLRWDGASDGPRSERSEAFELIIMM